MNERELFKKTFDAVPVPEYLAARAAANSNSKSPRRVPRRALRTAALIVLAVALLSVAAAAGFFGSKSNFSDLCNDEIARLREMGLFHVEFEVDEFKAYNDVGFLRSEDDYLGRIEMHGRNDDVSYNVIADTDTGMICGLAITAWPHEDTEPAFYDELGGWYIYDNFDAIFDTDMTVGEYCEIWRQYQGYERYELPEGVPPGMRLLDAKTLDAWGYSYEGDGIRIPFYRAGEAEPFYAWISYGATGNGPVVCFGDFALKG